MEQRYLELRRWAVGGTFALLISLGRVPAMAQSAPRGAEVTGIVGYAGFVDEGGPVDHTTLGAAVRIPLTRRLAIGPQVVYMVGPRTDRDLFVTAAITWDLLGRSAGGPPRVVPYLVADVGFMTHYERFGVERFSSTEGAASGGGGVRVHATDRVVVGGEFRAGWELHYRLVATVGYRFGR